MTGLELIDSSLSIQEAHCLDVGTHGQIEHGMLGDMEHRERSAQ